MAQTATLCILEIKDLELLQNAADSGIKKNWLGRVRTAPGTFTKRLDGLVIEKIRYRWSGLAFAILAVFSNEKLGVDWNNLEYSNLANEFSEKTGAGIYIFSVSDDELFKLRPNGFYYSIEELDQFAIEFEGKKPANPEIMKNAVEVLEEALSKLTNEKVVLLLIE
jgi:hypothetical protein